MSAQCRTVELQIGASESSHSFRPIVPILPSRTSPIADIRRGCHCAESMLTRINTDDAGALTCGEWDDPGDVFRGMGSTVCA